MSNIYKIGAKKKKHEVEIDILVCYLMQPPALVPLSKRAKEVLDLPEGTDAAVFLEDTAEEVMGAFEDDYVLGMDDCHVPKNIVTMSIKLLH